MINKKIKNVLITSVVLFGFSLNTAYADSITNVLLDVYPNRPQYNQKLSSYLRTKKISEKEYLDFIHGLARYKDSKEETYTRAMSNMVAFDQVMFTHPDIKHSYSNSLKTYKNKDTAWVTNRKGMIYDTKFIKDTFEEAFNKNVDSEKVFEYLYKRKPTIEEKKYLSNIHSFKYALIGGELGRQITTSERSTIDADRGYMLFGLTKQQYDKYLDFMELRDKIEPLEIQYIKTNTVFHGVRNAILREHKIDILRTLSESKRLDIYNDSVVNFVFYDDYAKEACLKELIRMKKIRESVLGDDYINMGEMINGSNMEQNYPKEDDYKDKYNGSDNKHYNNVPPIPKSNGKYTDDLPISKLTPNYSLANIYKSVNDEFLENPLSKSTIHIIFENVDIDTGLSVEKGTISYDIARVIIEQLSDSFSSKIVKGKKDILLLMNNKVLILPETDSRIDFNKYRESLKVTGIDLVEKEKIVKN